MFLLVFFTQFPGDRGLVAAKNPDKDCEGYEMLVIDLKTELLS